VVTTEHIILYNMQKPEERGEGRGMKQWINNDQTWKQTNKKYISTSRSAPASTAARKSQF
jgi:hypothetical protein